VYGSTICCSSSNPVVCASTYSRVDPAVLDQLALERVHEREVGAVADRQVDVRLAGDRRRARVDAQQRGRVGATPAVEHPHPQHGLRLGDVVTEERECVAVVDVGVRGGLAVAAERRLERRRRGRRAQPRVAVHVRRADAGLPEHGERVVLLQVELTGGVEADAAPAAGIREQRLRALDDAAHRRVPIGLDQPLAVAHQRAREPVGRVVGLPAVEVLGVEPAAVDAVGRPAADAGDPPAAHRDVHRVAVGVQHRRRPRPALRLALRQVLVDPHGPILARPVGGPLAPGSGDPVVHDRITTHYVGGGVK
jgi:hypothetical protein